ncbi:hypothetical protein ABMA28_017244, partial [Loxostege sticticalis]
MKRNGNVLTKEPSTSNNLQPSTPSSSSEVIDACIEAETAERFCQKNQEAFFDSAFDTALYQAVEDFEN